MTRDYTLTQEGPCCAHRRVEYRRDGETTVTREWWECVDCKTEFRPFSPAALQSIAGLETQVAELQARLDAMPHAPGCGAAAEPKCIHCGVVKPMHSEREAKCRPNAELTFTPRTPQACNCPKSPEWWPQP